MMGKENQIKRVLLRPRRERRAGMTDQHREAGPSGASSQDVPCLTQLDLGLLAHRDVVRTGSALPAAPGRTCLRCQGHDRQLATCFCEFSRLSQRRFARVARLEDGENASHRRRSLGVERIVARLRVSGLRHKLSHVEQRYRELPGAVDRGWLPLATWRLLDARILELAWGRTAGRGRSVLRCAVSHPDRLGVECYSEVAAGTAGQDRRC